MGEFERCASLIKPSVMALLWMAYNSNAITLSKETAPTPEELPNTCLTSLRQLQITTRYHGGTELNRRR